MVYLIDFWATWCAPCIADFPELTEVQEEYEGRVRVVAVAIAMTMADEERVEHIEEFLDSIEAPQCTVAVDRARDTADAWMRVGSRKSLPIAFIVDGSGTVVWMGRSREARPALERVLAGEDVSMGEPEWRERDRWEWSFNAVNVQLMVGDDGYGAEVVWEALEREFPGKAEEMKSTAINVAMSGSVEKPDLVLAAACAISACELTGWKDPEALMALACVHHRRGMKAEANRVFEKAIELQPDDGMRDRYRYWMSRSFDNIRPRASSNIAESPASPPQ